ncbi:MAG: hypothetical protein ABSC32_12955 [Steroidobacteraceae bacterium]|jgi:uncharacterized protein involved in exopolysaccharide biosynthesis
MRFSQFFGRLRRARGWSREILLAGLALAFGFLLMPVLIFYAGASLLGRYEGASIGRTFQGLYGGLQTGSLASWIVLLGPYGLYLFSRALRLWWRAGARPA